MENVSEWNIENYEEEQVFQKMGYGIKLVIPQSSVEKGKQVKAKVNVVAPAKVNIEYFPSDVELVSCFYEIKTTGKFKQPIELCLQHNVEVTSQEQCKQFAFIRAKGPPPYIFEVVPFNTTYPKFKVNDNSGIVNISDFSILGIGWIIDPLVRMLRQPSCSYLIAVFVKYTKQSYWEIHAVITRDLQPFFEVGNIQISYKIITINCLLENNNLPWL